MTLTKKTTLMLAAIVAAAVSAACVLLVHYQEQSLKETIFEGVDAQAKLAARGIDFFVAEGVRDASAIALTIPADALRARRGDRVEAHLERMARTFSAFQNGIFVLDGEGTFLFDYPPHPELRGESFAFREYYQRTVRERAGIAGTPYRSKRTGLPVLTFTAPVYDDGGIVAIVAASADLLSLEALGGYHRQTFGKTGYLYMFDRDRVLLLHPEKDRLLTRVEAGKNKVLEAALEGFEGVGETVNSKGVAMLIAVHRIPRTGWWVAVQVTQEEAYAPVRAARARMGVVAVASVLLAVVLGLLAVRRVSKPLRQLESIASRIHRELEHTERTGTYSLPQEVVRDLDGMSRRDEVGTLAASFRDLATRLQLTLGSLERSANARVHMERELRQAQKLEAVGRLAGGVAHDFNNMLAVILSAGRFLREELPADHALREAVDDIVGTGDRAASLVRQLLDFSRTQTIEPTAFDLAQAVLEQEKMLRRIVGEKNELELAVQPGRCCIRAVPSQILQVVMNLVVNARDAMPSGGKVTVGAAPLEPGDPALGAEALPAGPLVALVVSDTGVGMDEATAARVFEPFFTTKGPGNGTGLGLSTVYGIVHQSGGVVRVTSAPGKGTTFRVYVPRVVQPEAGTPARDATLPASRRNGSAPLA
jgi:signal transduction histidine kinase